VRPSGDAHSDPSTDTHGNTDQAADFYSNPRTNSDANGCGSSRSNGDAYGYPD
jgi:hypothetical protein